MSTQRPRGNFPQRSDTLFALTDMPRPHVLNRCGQNGCAPFFVVLFHMHSLYVVFIAVLLDLTAALPYHAPLAIPIHKRSSLTTNGIIDLESARSHIAYSAR